MFSTPRWGHHIFSDGMEEWYLQFEARWRSIGKEADLARIRDVMQRVTRILRDRKAS